VNTKKSALEIYNQLKNNAADYELLPLSTSMFPAHRVQIINRIKSSLETGIKSYVFPHSLLKQV
jgi:CRISPR/Cas system-associated endonuclease/helicase Cas3